MWKYLIPIASVILAAGLAWGAWTTTSIFGMTPREAHDADTRELRQDIQEQQEIMVDRLEKIWQKIK